MKDVYITRAFGIGWYWKIDAADCGKRYYYDHTKREALKKWREEMGLKYKHLNIIEY